MGDGKLRILYDELGFMEPHGGVSRYFTELVKHLPDGFCGRFSAVCSNNEYLQNAPFCLPRMQKSVQEFISKDLHGHSFPGVSHVYHMLAKCFPCRFYSGELANRKAFAREVEKGEFDILHMTDPHPHCNWWKHVLGYKPIVATVHDLIPELYSNDRRVRCFRARLLHDASHIIAVSQNTRRDLIRLYGVPEKKVSVVYHGYTSRSLPENDGVATLTVKPKTCRYILFVGKRGGYKNFDFFVRALAPLIKANEDVSIYCTGTAFTGREQALLTSLDIASKVVQAFVPDAEFPALFASASAFVYPSRYEGFGIPILDAFATGCPAVLSNSSCFPEVAGDAALYFDPTNVDDLRRTVSRLMDSTEMRQELISKGSERIKQFSWERCAKETAGVYEMISR